MKYLITLLSILLSLAVYAQELILKSQYYEDSQQLESTFNVLKSDTITKHGEVKIYKKIAENDYKYFIGPEKERLVKVRGQYSNGIKTGIWNLSLDQNYSYNFDSNELINPKIKFKYPLLAREFGIQGDVIIKYNIDETCKLSSIKFIGDEKLVKGTEQVYKEISGLYQIISDEIGNCIQEEKVDTIKYRL